jgi:light-harvesting complex I chlorophyll a/b binding protein 1
VLAGTPRGFRTIRVSVVGFDPAGLKPTSKGEAVKMATMELNNGRLAMLGIAGMVAQELVTGAKIL